MDKEIMKGSIDILLLSLLNKRDMYGYEIVKTLKENSNELYNMSEGTLYPALKRLENKNGFNLIGKILSLVEEENIIGLQKMEKGS